MTFIRLLPAIALLSLPLEGVAQMTGGAEQAGGTHLQGEDLLMRNSLSQSEIKRLAEQIDQWNRAAGDVGVSPEAARYRTQAMLGALKIPCEVSRATFRGSMPADSGQQVYEAVCERGFGYLLALRGSDLRAVSCLAPDRDSLPVKCELPGNSASPAQPPAETAPDSRPTLAWFKEVLASRGIACQVKRARIVGRESIKRRYVVEFECTDRAGGLVAFVPPADDTVNAFESMDCASAAGQGIRCELLPGAPPANPG